MRSEKYPTNSAKDLVGTGSGAMAGVLVKNAEVLEVMEKVDTLVVVKTGTLTEGKPRLASIEASGGLSEDDLLRGAASLERGSEHPLAAAVVAGAGGRGLALSAAVDFEARPGQGVVGAVEGEAVALGNRQLLEHLGVTAGPLLDRVGDRCCGHYYHHLSCDGC